MGDPFGNFNRRANILSNYTKLKLDHPLTQAAIDILKQMDCVLDCLADNRESEEELQLRLRDISVIAKLMIVMLNNNPDIFPIEPYGKTQRENDEIEANTYNKESEESNKDEHNEEKDNREEKDEAKETKKSVHRKGQEDEKGIYGKRTPITKKPSRRVKNTRTQHGK